jgi:hypothetical protein
LLESGARNLQLLLRNGQRRVHLLQSLPFRRNLVRDLGVLVHRQRPLTKRRTSLVLIEHVVGRVLRVALQLLAELAQRLLLDVVLVEVLQAVDEIGVPDDTLDVVPVRLLAQQDADGFKGKSDELGRGAESLDLGDIGLVDCVEGANGVVEGR